MSNTEENIRLSVLRLKAPAPLPENQNRDIADNYWPRNDFLFISLSLSYPGGTLAHGVTRVDFQDEGKRAFQKSLSLYSIAFHSSAMTKSFMVLHLP